MENFHKLELPLQQPQEEIQKPQEGQQRYQQ